MVNRFALAVSDINRAEIAVSFGGFKTAELAINAHCLRLDWVNADYCHALAKADAIAIGGHHIFVGGVIVIKRQGEHSYFPL